jgi:nucleotide-binding universal stress UspA family protein
MSEQSGVPTPSGHVIVGVDGSPTSDLAVDHAAGEAVRRRLPLEILHALEWTELGRGDDRFGRELRENAETIVESAAGRARDRHPGLAVTARVEFANAIDMLEDASGRAALLVVGSRGLGGFAGLLMGSVSLPVAAAARCPLLVVHPEHKPVAAPGARVVVVGVSDGACAPAIEAAFTQARTRGLPLRAVHAWSQPLLMAAVVPYVPPPSLTEDWAEAARKVLTDAVAPFRSANPDVEVTEQVEADTPAHALLAWSEDADVIVLAAHRRTGRFGPNLGRVTHAVLHHAKAPVLLVPVAE